MLTCSFVIPGSQCLISGLWHGTDEEIPWRLGNSLGEVKKKSGCR